MECREVIRNRRSIRKFDSKKIEKHIVEEIIYEGSLAPSGKNRQPWRFVVLQEDEQVKNKIVEIMLEKAEEKIKNGEKAGSIKNTARIMKEAPVFIVVFNCLGDRFMNSNIQSIGACIQNMCLSATNLGIGSLWICDIACCFKEIEELLGVHDMSCVAGVSLGYSLENPTSRPRRKVEEITEWR